MSGRLRKMVWVRVHPKSCILSVSTCIHGDLSDSHFGSTSVDTVLPNQVVPISVDDRVSCMRSVKHLSRVEYERPIDRVDARVCRHPVLSISWMVITIPSSKIYLLNPRQTPPLEPFPTPSPISQILLSVIQPIPPDSFKPGYSDLQRRSTFASSQ